MLLPGEILMSASWRGIRKSAEAIIVFGNEPSENDGGLTEKPKG